MPLRLQQSAILSRPSAAGIVIPALDAFVADRVHGFDPTPWLPRGRVVTPPVLDSTDDVPLDLADHVGDRHAVLLFYQGGWSRPCNHALAAFQAVLPRFDRAGAAVVAITPELPIHALETSQRNGLEFLVAIDHACRFAKSLGLAFKLPLEIRRTARDFGVRLKLWNGEGSYDLPMPALLLIDRKRRIARLPGHSRRRTLIRRLRCRQCRASTQTEWASRDWPRVAIAARRPVPLLPRPQPTAPSAK